MKFLLELLGITNQCNLRCDYCDWKKDEYKELNEQEVETAKGYLRKIKEIIDKDYPEIGVVQYSGGEPLLYPEILDEVFKVFDDKWIRINTNGVFINESILEKAKEHGKVYIAVSLDGSSMKANYPRVNTNESLFNKIIENVDKVVKSEIPLMILCTLNKHNIDEFPGFVRYLSEKYKVAIEKGMLVMPTHCVTSYSKDNGAAEMDAIDRFNQYINLNVDKYKVLSAIKDHYENIGYYMKNKYRKEKCNVYDWSLSMHFRGNEIISDGNFLSFGCGMRGVHELGYFNINKEEHIKEFEEKVANYNFSRNLEYYNSDKQVSEYNALNDNCEGKCFPDWVIFDLILSNKVSLEKAGEWFVLFRDEKIKELITEYREQKKYLTAVK